MRANTASPTSRLRPAQIADLGAIGCLWQDFMAAHAALDPACTPASDGVAAFQRHLASTILGHEDALLMVAEDGEGGLCSYVLARQALLPPVFAQRRHGLIADLMVAPGHRRQGLGRALAERALAWLAARGETRVELRILGENAQALAFWQRLGFEQHFITASRTLAP